MEITFATILGEQSAFQVDDAADADGWLAVRYGDVQLGQIRLGAKNEQREHLEPVAHIAVDDDGVPDPETLIPAPQWEHAAHRLLLLKQVCAHLTPRETEQ